MLLHVAASKLHAILHIILWFSWPWKSRNILENLEHSVRFGNSIGVSSRTEQNDVINCLKFVGSELYSEHEINIAVECWLGMISAI